MSAKFRVLFSLDTAINQFNAVTFSPDNRASICTKSGIYILDLQTKLFAFQRSIYKSFIDTEQLVEFVPQYKTVEIAKASEKDLIKCHEFKSDVALYPQTYSNGCRIGYKSAEWSPASIDGHGRCLLCTLAFDHRLSLYVQNKRQKWDKVSDLTALYSNYVSTLHNFTTHEEYIDFIYRQAPVTMAWSDVLYSESDDKFSLLAVAMKNADMVLWKMPVTLTESDFKILGPVLNLSSEIKCMKWYPTALQKKTTAFCAVGCNNGTVHIVRVKLENDEKPSATMKTIHDESDMMQPSCMCWKVLSEDQCLLIVAKNCFLLAYLLSFTEGIITVIKQTHQIGNNALPFTSLSYQQDYVLASSEDGLIQKIYFTPKNREQLLECKLLDFTIPEFLPIPLEMRWTFHGLCVSPNNMFAITCMSPSSYTDAKKIKEPLKVIKLSLVDTESNIQKVAQKLCDGPENILTFVDVMDELTERYVKQISLPLCIQRYIDNRKRWADLTVRMLQIIRFLVISAQQIKDQTQMNPLLHDKVSADACSEEVRSHVENCLIILNIKSVISIILSQKRDFSLEEKKILSNLNILAESPSISSINKELKTNIAAFKKAYPKLKDKALHVQCPICRKRLDVFQSLKVKCINDHTFGLCCKSFYPCHGVGYRKCMSCGIQALSEDELKELFWISKPNECGFCNGPLM